MTEPSTFSPDWISPPGDTIAELLQERGLSLHQFSEQLGVPLATATDLLHGVADLTTDLARGLETLLGTPASFWLRRESRYRQLTSIEMSKALQARYRQWLSEIPIGDMAKFGWVERKDSPVEQVSECLDFFGKGTISEWSASSDDFLRGAALRTSPTFASKPGALSAWLRQGEREAAKTACGAWNADALRRALADIRPLTRKRDPAKFLPELLRVCGACGVAVVIARTPTGCRASGATRFLSPQKALVLLSFRYLSDDHFWFTFFHEVAHLLLHNHGALFLEGKDRGDSKEEQEANEFSARILIPRENVAELMSLGSDALPVTRFAKRLDISPGIVVGQLQHHGVIPRDHLNHLKTRFKWTD